MNVICSYCSTEIDKPNGAVNRANKEGKNLYCNRECAGLGRQLNKSDEQNKEHKRLYDIKYRADNLESIKIKKIEWFIKDYAANPEKYKQIRKNKYKKHLEYLSTDKYKAYKKEYDKVHRAKSKYGEFYESSIILNELCSEIDRRQADIDNNTYNKAQKRKRNINY